MRVQNFDVPPQEVSGNDAVKMIDACSFVLSCFKALPCDETSHFNTMGPALN